MLGRHVYRVQPAEEGWIVTKEGEIRARGGGAGERDILARCYRSCLAIAFEQRFREIAFPAIATGVYGFPKEEAARIAVAAVRAYMTESELPERVAFVCFDEPTIEAYRLVLRL